MKRALPCVLVLVAGASARADFVTGFEPPTYSASAAGNPMAGQDGWYVPAVAGSIDHSAMTYAGNAYGIVNNPTGGLQFDSGRSLGGTSIARTQHNAPFSFSGTWTASWDCLGMFNGTLPAADNLGSFSLQPSTTADYWQQIMQWGANNTTATVYNINYGSFPAGGGIGGVGIVFNSPGPAWQNIPVNHWIHQSTTWDFVNNKILSVSIQDITAGGPLTTVDVSALNWYLAGGANNAAGGTVPTDVRLFA